MPRTPRLILPAALLLASLQGAQPGLADPRPLRDDIQVRKVAEIAGNTIRIARDPRDNALYLAAQDGQITRIDAETGTSELVYTAADHGIATNIGIGLAIGPDGAMYLLGSQPQGRQAVATIARGVPDGAGGRTWSVLARTEPYPLNGAANDDHAFNTLAVSPDNRFLFVANGSRTDHGEVQDNRGAFPGLREAPLSNAIFRLPTDGQELLLPNDEQALRASGYLFAKGLRNNFDMAFAPNGDFFGVDNGPDRDMVEELNWLREGHHYGFPWRMGVEDNPQRFPDYDPDADLFVPEGFVRDRGFYRNDPNFPPPPAVEFTDPIPNLGPDADKFREAGTGAIRDASDLGLTLSTFTPHRSPLGLVFDTEEALSEQFRGDGFVLNIGDAIAASLGAPFGDPDQDLLHLDLEKVDGEYRVRVTRLVENFNAPIDAEIVGNKIYVVEFQPAWLRAVPRFLWELTLPPRAQTAVLETEDRDLPDSFSLEPNFPNPFNPSTTIEYHLAAPAAVELAIFNASGQKVRTLIQTHQPAGRYTLGWDGTDGQGQRLASGPYFYRLQAGSFEQTRQLTLLK